MAFWSALLFWLEWLVRLGMLPVVIRRKGQPAVCLAWLTIIFLVPFVGLAAYVLIGEVRLGARRIRRHARDVDVVAKADRPDIQLQHIVQPEVEKTQQVLLHIAGRVAIYCIIAICCDNDGRAGEEPPCGRSSGTKSLAGTWSTSKSMG